MKVGIPSTGVKSSIITFLTLIGCCILFLLIFLSLSQNFNLWKIPTNEKGESLNYYKNYILQLFKENANSEYFKLQEVIDGIKQDDPRIIKYIRENHLTPPTSRNIPYNLYYKHLEVIGGGDPSSGEVVTKEILKVLGNYTNGLFIEAGADDGESGSNSLLLERDLNWTGVLIEPQPVSLKKLYTKNRRAWISNVCTSPSNSPSKMEFIQFPNYEIASQLVPDRKNYKNVDMNKTEFEFISVQCFPIYSVLTALGWNKIDFFSLDVEAYEFDVLKTIPWDKIQFKVITVEAHRNPLVKEAVKDFLKMKGYIFIKQIFLCDFLFGHESLEYFKHNKHLLNSV